MYTVSENGLHYSINEKLQSVMLIDVDTKEVEVKIPSIINGYPVIGIGKNAFANNKYIKTVLLPDTIIWIYENAFRDSSIKEFKVYKSENMSHYVYEPLVIRQSVFKNCTSLEVVKLKNPTILGESKIFENCYKLEVFSSGYIEGKIPHHTFRNCTSLLSVGFRAYVTIEKDAFADAKVGIVNDYGYIQSFKSDFMKAIHDAKINCYKHAQFVDLAYEGFHVNYDDT